MRELRIRLERNLAIAAEEYKKIKYMQTAIKKLKELKFELESKTIWKEIEEEKRGDPDGHTVYCGHCKQECHTRCTSAKTPENCHVISKGGLNIPKAIFAKVDISEVLFGKCKKCNCLPDSHYFRTDFKDPTIVKRNVPDLEAKQKKLNEIQAKISEAENERRQTIEEYKSQFQKLSEVFRKIKSRLNFINPDEEQNNLYILRMINKLGTDEERLLIMNDLENLSKIYLKKTRERN